jgi:tetratricopeptide (TPR) repeat protein
MDPSSAFPLVLIAAMPGQTRRYGGLVIVGLALATIFNLPWLAKYLQVAKATDSQILQLLSNPTVMVGANFVAGALIVWGLFKLLLASNPKQRLVRTLIGRGDYVGAAQLQAQEGDLRGALTLYRKGKAWTEAARTALELGHDHEAADLLRRAGGHNLAEATRLFRRAGDIAAAQRCERDLAEWLSSRGRYDEAVEAWMRAGEPKRAAGAAMIALEQGQFSSSHTALPMARRAVEQAGDHRALARLHEIEGNWQAAAHAWRSAGEHKQAAEIFRKAGLIHEAAIAESAAGHHQEAAQLRIRQLKKLRDRLSQCEARGSAGDEESEKLREQIVREEEALIPILSDLGMQREPSSSVSIGGVRRAIFMSSRATSRLRPGVLSGPARTSGPFSSTEVLETQSARRTAWLALDTCRMPWLSCTAKVFSARPARSCRTTRGRYPTYRAWSLTWRNGLSRTTLVKRPSPACSGR